MTTDIFDIPDFDSFEQWKVTVQQKNRFTVRLEQWTQ